MHRYGCIKVNEDKIRKAMRQEIYRLKYAQWKHSSLLYEGKDYRNIFDERKLSLGMSIEKKSNG